MKNYNSQYIVNTIKTVLAVIMLCAGTAIGAPEASKQKSSELRRTISLDGEWEIAEGSMDKVPEKFDRKVPVPGLVEMATPSFDEVGIKSAKREAFWYRRTFQVTGEIPDVARLKVHKAMFGTRVILNGTLLGDHLPSFTPGYFDAKPALRIGENNILVRVGAFRDSVARPVPTGWDEEKRKFIPGIFDSVELILSGSPNILRVQAVPDIDKQVVTVHAWIRYSGAPAAAKLKFVVREAVSGKVAGEGECDFSAAGEGAERTGQVTIPVRDCRLWSPEDPFLYELEARGEADILKTRFGMRTFRFDRATGRAILNGKPCFMRGSNVTMYRFFEDPERGDKPWREEWVRRLHKAFRGMKWNCLRYCIGFPPEFWYRIADEEGVLIQDEFPIWNMEPKPGDFSTDELVVEYTEWMQERWNHPCVVIWDACNETSVREIGKAIQKVRGLDYSNRPWDNGWGGPGDPADVSEQHPYHFFKPSAKLSDMAKDNGMLGWKPNAKNPIIVNEYGWLWLNRDGTVTTLTKDLYRNLLGPDSTTAQRRHLYARYLAAETEFWRSHRACAAVMHFCGLGYSRSDGQTSDHWLDLEKLTWEPEFITYVKDAFAPVGLMIDAWAEEYTGGVAKEFPVVVINDLYDGWKGTVRFRLLRDGVIVQEKTQDCEVAALGKTNSAFTVDIPAQAGKYQVEAALIKEGSDPVRSLRDFNVVIKSAPAAELRQTISLDGTWEIAEGSMDKAPDKFDRKIPVPGLLDMAKPAFDEVGFKSAKREAFWYRRTFQVTGSVPEVARLKVHKAMFGTRVILNGKSLGDHLPSFTPGYFDAREALRVGENEILVRVGAFRESVPRPVPAGWDYEKVKFVPGIFDSVELIMSGSPHILRVQTVPDVEKKTVTVHAWVRYSGNPSAGKLKLTVREAASGKVAGEGECEISAAGEGMERVGKAIIPISDCRLWSPEDPFLYELEARGQTDNLKTRFGMRSFRLDRATGRAILNGKPYFMRGSNITLYRFFEDDERLDKPWREEWVRRLHKACHGMKWNCLRYCIGFPPEFWYRIADEEGILIQDEFPIWHMKTKPGDLASDELAVEYTEWMQERWNHPCVVIWDACNETRSPETSRAIAKVRGLDFSNRPWDDGWRPPADPSDSIELHPYHFQNPNFKLSEIARDDGMLGWTPGGKNPIIVNEYGWLWLNRDGTPTTLTKDLYRNLLGPDATTAQRRHLYARLLAAETEFWRSHRACAAVMHFCMLGYSRSGEKPRPEGGATSDHWTDIEKLTWEPEFLAYVKDAFAPVGLMIDAWAEEYPGGAVKEFPVVVINDLYDGWKGTVRFRLLRDGSTVQEKTQVCEVAALGKTNLAFTVDVPGQAGKYQVEAALIKDGAEPVRSLRDFRVMNK